MITGSVCFDASDPSFSILLNSPENLSIKCHSVSAAGFRGAFYTHHDLPASDDDFWFVDKGRDIVVLMSGSVYNRESLKPGLRAQYQMRDPHLIAELFLEKGLDFVDSLNGDYAVFILNPQLRRAFFFRDHLGICPMTWAMDRKTIHFSSDPLVLSRVFPETRKTNSEYLLRFLKYVDNRLTPDDRIHKLPPGHVLCFTGKGVDLRKYWFPERIMQDRKLSYETMLENLGELVADAVKIRSSGSYTAGAHVSSGIDSGVVSALARREYSHQKEFYGLSWSPAVNFDFRVKYDERVLISGLCDHAGILPHYSAMNRDDFMRCMSDYYLNKGYFSEDETTDRARSLGINLIFSGFGGDEFISTGHSGIDLDLLRSLMLPAFFRRNSLRHPKRFLRNIFFYVINPFLHILDQKTKKAFSKDARYLKKPFKKSNREAIRNFYFHRSRREMHLNVLRFSNIPARCESWYVMGYRKGIEYRYPLLDKRIIEEMLKVPSRLLIKTAHFRPLLREIGRGILPEEVRLNESKNDPVYWRWMDDLIKDSALALMDEAETWKSNPDLEFIDFGLLSGDISRYRTSAAFEHSDALFKSLVYFKALHEFTVKIRENN